MVRPILGAMLLAGLGASFGVVDGRSGVGRFQPPAGTHRSARAKLKSYRRRRR